MSNTICNAIRNSPALTHDDMRDVMACLAAMVGRPMNELSDRSTKVVIDLIDEINGQIEADQIEQEQETAWHKRQDLPGFERTYAQLDALALHRAAA